MYMHGNVWVRLPLARLFRTSVCYALSRSVLGCAGALIQIAACKLLHIPIFRYVDDFFGFDRPESLEHATMCIVRLIRCCLGPDAVADRKVDFGPSLTILGIDLSLSKAGYMCGVSRAKAAKCIEAMRTALRTGVPDLC